MAVFYALMRTIYLPSYPLPCPEEQVSNARFEVVLEDGIDLLERHLRMQVPSDQEPRFREFLSYLRGFDGSLLNALLTSHYEAAFFGHIQFGIALAVVRNKYVSAWCEACGKTYARAKIRREKYRLEAAPLMGEGGYIYRCPEKHVLYRANTWRS